MINTYLDADAMLKRINVMQEQAEAVFQQIEKTKGVMEELKRNFEGASAARLQEKYNNLANTFNDLLSYLKQKADDMQTLTTNVTRADEEK